MAAPAPKKVLDGLLPSHLWIADQRPSAEKTSDLEEDAIASTAEENQAGVLLVEARRCCEALGEACVLLMGDDARATVVAAMKERMVLVLKNMMMRVWGRVVLTVRVDRGLLFVLLLDAIYL